MSSRLTLNTYRKKNEILVEEEEENDVPNITQ